MTASFHRLRLGAFALALLVVVAACTEPAPLPSPPTVPTPSASAEGTATPSVTLLPATATSVATPSPTTAADCAIEPEDGTLSSDRLTGVVVSATDEADLLTFVFGNPSLGPQGPPRGELSEAEPPFTFGPSGQPIDMTGRRVVQIVFRQMSLQADTGQPVYTGATEIRPDLEALRHAVEFDESEGVIGWYVGFDGPGCVTLTRSGNDLTLAFAHG